MIDSFEAGKWYIWVSSEKGRPSGFNGSGLMDFMLDGKPHKCKTADGRCASFYDQPNGEEWGENHQWTWVGSLDKIKECSAPIGAPQMIFLNVERTIDPDTDKEKLPLFPRRRDIRKKLLGL